MKVWPFAAAVALLFANGFFVAVEFAVVGSRRTKLQELAAAGDRRAERAMAALTDLNRELGGAQLGITMASLGLGVVAEPAVAELITPLVEITGASEALAHSIALGIALVIVVFFHLVVGEMVPKNVAIVDPERTLLRLAPLDRAYLFLFGPIVAVLTALANGGLRLMGVRTRRELAVGHTAEELALMVATSREEGVIEDFAADLMAGVLDFGGRDVSAVMVPRERIATISIGTSVAEAERVVLERGHSRLLVTGRDLDDVRGFIHAKDLLTVPAEAASRPVPLRLVRRMLDVPCDRSLEDLLLGMRRARVHVAVVRDPDGRTAGLVTLEDLVEELVGDILDESDRPSSKRS
ncbi:hemolysin family protein [Rhabdothermincola sediminis]|uniref:hemolysin family protein n=1 Tax=Rhabdothermincola sediminis TaxID=2751370 RepID=UPI001AA03BA9|nr:hemolysin family protein [Rhabdothermincola sediminis]